MYFCAFFPLVMICQQCCPLPECKGAGDVAVYVPVSCPRGGPNPSTYGHCLTAAITSPALLTSPMCCCLCAFFSVYLVSAFMLHSAFLSCTLLSVHPLFFCFSSQPCWRHFLPLGNDLILLQGKPIPSPSSSLTHPESWEQETVIFLRSRTSWAIATQQGSKQAHIKGTPTERSSPEAPVPLGLVIIPASESCASHLISSLPCPLFLLQAQQRNLLSIKLPEQLGIKLLQLHFPPFSLL